MLLRNYTEVLLTLLENKKKKELEQAQRQELEEKESPCRTLLSITIPFFIAGFGMVGAGILLDVVEKWPLYQDINEIIVLVPALLGLKGNLEMTLASRLSTQVNIGIIHDKKTTLSALFGNSIIIQLQSIIVGFLAAFIAVIFQYVKIGTFHPGDFLIVITSSVITASMASLILASLVMCIIIVSHRFNVNPDNIATPIASSLGDVVTLAILSGFGTLFHDNKEYTGVPIAIVTIYVILIPIFVYICYKNEFVKETLYQGWVPIIAAMLISTAAGAILDESNKTYSVVSVYQPVINGVGGNLVAIMASRLSTSIHRSSIKGEYPTWAPKSIFSYPYQTFFGSHNPEAKTIQLLVLLILPGHITFFFTLFYIPRDGSAVELSASLVIFYLLIAFIQVIILFLICYWLVLFAWKLGKNPDNICIPYLTAIGDFLGVSFLLFAMYMVYLTGNTSVLKVADTPLDSFMANTTLMANSTALY